MHGRKPDQFRLKPKDGIVLRELLRDGRTPLLVARRAQIFELRPKNWTQKQRFLVNSRASGLLGGPLVLELDRGQVA